MQIIVYSCNLYLYNIIHLNSNISHDFFLFYNTFELKHYAVFLIIPTLCRILFISTLRRIFVYSYYMKDYCLFMQFVSLQYITLELKHYAGFLFIHTICRIFVYSYYMQDSCSFILFVSI